MRSADETRTLVRERYATIARERASASAPSACGCGPNMAPDGLNAIGDAYAGVAGHVEEADLNLGCGVPTRLAALAAGQTVLDLGSGAGNDAFIARHEVGPEGRVIGVDMTPEMIAKARANAPEARLPQRRVPARRDRASAGRRRQHRRRDLELRAQSRAAQGACVRGDLPGAEAGSPLLHLGCGERGRAAGGRAPRCRAPGRVRCGRDGQGGLSRADPGGGLRRGRGRRGKAPEAAGRARGEVRRCRARERDRGRDEARPLLRARLLQLTHKARAQSRAKGACWHRRLRLPVAPRL